MKVFVLVNEWNLAEVNGGNGCEVMVFATLESAQEKMKAESDFWTRQDGSDNYTTTIDEMSIEIYEEYNYDYNHMSWTIYEEEVQH